MVEPGCGSLELALRTHVFFGKYECACPVEDVQTGRCIQPVPFANCRHIGNCLPGLSVPLPTTTMGVKPDAEELIIELAKLLVDKFRGERGGNACSSACIE